MDFHRLIRDVYSPEDTVLILNEYLNPIPALEPSDLLDLVVSKEIRMLVGDGFKFYGYIDSGFETIWQTYYMAHKAEDLKDNPNRLQILNEGYELGCEIFGKPMVIDPLDKETKIEVPYDELLWFRKDDIVEIIIKHSDPTEQNTNSDLIEPIVKKGNTSSFDEWMRWRIKEQQRINLNELMPYGFQAILIEECKRKFDYKDNSAVRDSWKRLKIHASTDRNTRIT